MILSEAKLKKIISESLSNTLVELYKPRSRKKKLRESLDRSWFCGINGVRFIEHGEWSDPELEYNGHVVDVYDLEQYFMDEIKDMDDDEYVDFMRRNERDVKKYITEYGETDEGEEI